MKKFSIILMVMFLLFAGNAFAAPFLQSDWVPDDSAAPTSYELMEMQETSPCVWQPISGNPVPLTAETASGQVRLNFDLSAWSWCTTCAIQIRAVNSAGASAWTAVHVMDVPAQTITQFQCVNVPSVPSGLTIVP